MIAWTRIPSVRPDGVPPYVPREYWQTYVELSLLLGVDPSDAEEDTVDDDDVPF